MCLENRQKTAAMSECIYYVCFSKRYLGCVGNDEVRGKCTVNYELLETGSNGMARESNENFSFYLENRFSNISEAYYSIVAINLCYY